MQVDELDALRLSLSDVAIEEISTDVNLGDDEIGGPSNGRLSTQLAVRSFISNRLGGFVDKTVSTAAVPGAIVQLNVNGQLNPDLIPATRQFTNTNTQGYLSRLEQVDDIPATDLKAGDIATENYEQVELTLSGNISAEDGDIITQPGVVGAIGYAKNTYVNSGNILVATIGGAWDDTDDSTGDPWEVSAGNIYVNGVDSGISINSKGTSSEIIDNFFLRSSNTSQYLVLDPDESYTFTSATVTNVSRSSNIATITTSGAHNLNIDNNVQVLIGSDETYNENGLVLSVPSTTTFTIANEGSDEGTKAVTDSTARTIVTSADGNAQGAVTETRYGVLTNVDNANIVGGSLYTPTGGTKVYESVPLTATTGVGTGATANITITAGQVTDVDINKGGTGYAVGDLLSCNASDVGGTGSGFEIEVVAIEKRAYVNIIGGELYVASASSIDFIEDNTAVLNARDINQDDIITHNFLAGTLAGGGAVDYTSYRITIPNHGYGNGDPVTYDTLGNTPIGGLLNGSVYYTKRIDNSTIELYEDYSLLNIVEFLSTPANNNHNITRYTINLTDNSVILVNHGFTTGDAIRIETISDGSTANELFSVNGDAIPSGSRFFIGSVTTSSFTLHELRSDALSSINGLVTNSKDIDGTGIGSAKIIHNNVQVSEVINTSSRIKNNWNTLAVTNIDAENIISGTISPSRLASAGVANTDTFLRGDSSYAVVVQTLKKAATTDNPIVLTGSSIGGEFYGDPVNIGIANVDYDPLGTFSTLGTSRFLQTQFNVNTDGSGEVFIKDGVVDAGTLDSLDSAYFLNPANLTSLVPVNRGGTNISTYAVGDILYAQTTGSLNTLNIGRSNSFLKSNGTTPEWGTALDLSEGLDVGSARLSSTSTGSGRVYNDNVTSLFIGNDATNIHIGSNDASRSLTSVIESYEAVISQDVVVNLGSITQNTNAPTANGETEVSVADTTGILAGMIVTGSGSIPANTTVSGVTNDGFIYLSNATTGTVLTSTTLTFSYTPYTLGIVEGDSIQIAGSAVTNLDGTWPVVGATSNATSFTIRTDANVTALPNNVPAGTISILSSMVLSNRNIILGNAEASTAPVGSTIKGTAGIGTDVAGGSITIEGGLGTGNATGGDVVIKTGAVSTTSDIEHTSTERIRVDTSGKTTVTGYADFTATTAIKVPVGTGAQRPGEVGVSLAAAQGQIRYNTTDSTFEGYDGANWGSLGGVKDVDGNTYIVAETSAGANNNDLDFWTDNVHRLQIDQDGDFRFGDALNKFIIDWATGNTDVAGNVVITGNLTVNGTTTTIDTATLQVEDKNIELGTVASPTDVTADGGGITLKGTTDKTLNWIDATDSWTSSENFELASSKAYRINGSSVLNSTTLGSGVVNSSLQQVGTIGTGTWQGSIISPTYGGTGINNGTKTITLGGNLTTSGAFTSNFTMTGNTAVTFPTSGTLAITGNGLNQFAATTSAQLAGVISDETGSGALVFGTSPSFTTGINAASGTMALFNTTATTINFGGAATNIQIGATTGTTNVNNNLDVDGDINIDGGDLTFSDAAINIANTTPTTITMGNAATAFTVGATTGTFTVRNATTTLNGNLNVNGSTIDSDETGTFNLLKDNVKTLAFAQAATNITVGETKAAADLAGELGEMVVRMDIRTNNDMYIDGDLFVSQINNTPIGNITPASGAFTTLAANNLVTFTDATNATGAAFATGAAAVKITGGLYVAKDIRADNFIGDMDASYLTSGTLPDARIAVTGVTQHQASITGTGALNSGSITSGFGNINIGTSIFSGDGSGITSLNASNLSSGTVPDARIASTSITQHQAQITGTGQLTSGSIASGFGNINIGTNTFTGNGSGLTTLNASNLSTGTVSGNRLGGNQTMTGVKTFSDTSASTSTTTGAVRVGGGLGVAGALYAGSLNTTDGSGIQSLNGSNISTGTVPVARVSGSYTNITGTGALDQGSITSGFGNINIGTSTFTGNGSGLTSVDAATLDGIDSTQFLRSDVADTMGALLTISHAGDEMLRLQDTSATGSPYVSWYQSGTRRAYMQYNDSLSAVVINNDETGEQLRIKSGTAGLTFVANGTEYAVYHQGYVAGINADTLDGIDSTQFLRSDTNDSFSGTLSGTGSINISGTIAATQKSFVIDHPTKEGMKLRHGALEGPEDAVYVRGRLKDNNVIELPEYWTGLVDEDSITVNLTPFGNRNVWVEDIVNNTVIVGSDEPINCFYTVYGTRKDIDKWDIEYEDK